MLNEDPSLRQLCFWVSPLKSAVHSQLLPLQHTPTRSPQCGVWFFAGLGFLKAGVFPQAVYSKAAGVVSPSEQVVGR